MSIFFWKKLGIGNKFFESTKKQNKTHYLVNKQV